MEFVSGQSSGLSSASPPVCAHSHRYRHLPFVHVSLGFLDAVHWVNSTLHPDTGMSGWGGCLDGQDIFVPIRENSLPGEIVAELMVETTLEGVHWSLEGKDADWFILDERHIRLNTSADKVLDREVNKLGRGLVDFFFFF